MGAAGAGEAGTELVLVRHGQGECNAAGVIGGPRGCRGLSVQGRWESAKLAEHLAGLHRRRSFDVVLSSPRRRVLECAEIVATALGRHVVVVPDLRGQEFGAADGRPWHDVVRAFGGPPSSAPSRPIAEGAEPWNEYADRVLAALRGLLGEHAGRRILLVGHGRTAGLAGALLSGVADPRARAGEFVVDHGGLTHWRREPSGWVLLTAETGPAPAPAVR